jgi:hypothetical protein
MKMTLRRRTVTVVGLVILLFGCLVALLVWERQWQRPALQTQQQIEQLALQYAQQQRQGTVTALQIRRTTPRQDGTALLCDPSEHRLIRAAVLIGLQDYDQCDPDRVLWFIDLHGTFQWPTNSSDHIRVSFDAYGRFMSAGDVP